MNTLNLQMAVVKQLINVVSKTRLLKVGLEAKVPKPLNLSDDLFNLHVEVGYRSSNAIKIFEDVFYCTITPATSLLDLKGGASVIVDANMGNAKEIEEITRLIDEKAEPVLHHEIATILKVVGKHYKTIGYYALLEENEIKVFLQCPEFDCWVLIDIEHTLVKEKGGE